VENVGGKLARAIFIFTPAKAAKIFEEMSQRQVPIHELPAETFRESGWEILGPSPL
jgi:hypothetical protein